MANRGYPNQHTATTTVTSSNTAVQTNMRFDSSYIRTLPGMLKVGQLAVDIVGFICMVSSVISLLTRGTFYYTVAMISFLFTSIMLALYLFHIVEKHPRIPWLKIELVFCALLAFLYLIAASLVFAYGEIFEACGAAACFGYVAMLFYGIDACMKIKAVRAGEIAQGIRVVNRNSSTTDSPMY